MKRILCLIESLGSGGAERQLTGLAMLLKGDGNEVKVVTYFPKTFYKHVLDEAGVDYELVAKAQSKLRRFPEIAKTIRRYHPDTVITFSPAAGEIACILKMLGMRYRLIVSERCTSHENSSRERIKFFCCRWANWIVPNSHMQESFILYNYPHLKPKTKVITNFVDTDYFSPSEEISQDDSNRCNILCVGRDDPRKNILRFIDALKLLSVKQLKFHVDWYGKYENAYGVQCKNKIAELGLEEYITLKGETENVRDEYRCHDVFCLPSTSEGFPNVLCEAMSCGLPAVCGDVCDNPQILDDGKGGYLFNPTDVNDIEEKIERIVTLEKKKKKEMSSYNRKRAIVMFSASAFLKKYKELL